MGKLLLIAIILITSIATLRRPWVGISSYYLLSILGPQYIWWWNFEGLRVSLIVAIVTLTSIVLQVLQNNYHPAFLFNKQNAWLAFLWLCITVSYCFGPYVNFYASPGMRPEQLFSITNTIFLFYFCAVLEINALYKLRYLMIVFAISTIYLTFWANDQYLSKNWYQFNMGRLMGPTGLQGGSIYRDENAFAMLFVTGLPFIYYLGANLKKIWQQLLLWSVIPFGWHAIFLTGSRSGLIGLAIVMTCILLVSKRKKFVLPLLLAFIVCYQWQAGDTMKSRSTTIVDYEGESSAMQRIATWTGGLKMIVSHPVTGVGLGSFITALPSFYDTKPRVAHNTLIQFAAESGVGAGFAYLMVLWLCYRNFRQIRLWCQNNASIAESHQINIYNNASTVSFVGLVVCSMFLSLNTYEIFFVLLIFNNALVHICQKIDSQSPEINPIAEYTY